MSSALASAPTRAAAADPSGVLHDIRGSLTVMRGQAHAIVRTGGASAAVIERLRILDREIDRIATAVEHVRTAVGGAHGTVPAREVDLDGLVGEALRRHDGAAAAAGVRLLPVGRAGGPVTGWPDDLRRVLDNLIQNAIRAAGWGGLVIVVTAGGAASRTVRVVDRPAPSPTASARGEAGGWGMGMGIVRGIVAAHGGAVEVESSGPARGWTVRVTLPVAGPLTEAAR